MLGSLRVCASLLVVVVSIPVVAAEPPQSVDGVPLVPWKEADKHYGKEIIVYGRVVQTRNIQTMAFLNFDADFRKHFTAVIKQADFAAFPDPPEKMYRDKSVAIRGVVLEYREKPEMVIKSPRQIVILPGDGTDVVVALKGNMPASPAGGVATGAPASPVSTSSGQFTIAEVNFGDYFASGGTVEGKCPGDVPGYIDEATETVKSLNADIVAVQWGAGLRCLERLNEGPLKELGYAHVAAGTVPAGGNSAEAALLSRFPVQRAEKLTHFTNPKDERVDFGDQPLRADVLLPSNEMIQIVVVTTTAWGPEKERTSRMRGLSRLIQEIVARSSDTPLLVCGGFGAALDGDSTRVLLENDKGLAIPGYAAHQSKTEKPVIALIHNFILASDLLRERYTTGSTRVIQNDQVKAAVALSFQMHPAKPVESQKGDPAPSRNMSDDF